MKKGSVVIIALIIVILAIPVFFAIKHIYNRSLENKNFQIAQLTEQLKISRDDLDRKPPTPSPLPPTVRLGLIDKSNISSKNTYALNCWHGDSSQKSPLNKTLMDILGPQEHIYDICVNNELQKAALFTNNYRLMIYDIKSKSLKKVNDSTIGGGGTCELDIYIWSRVNDLFYKIIPCELWSEPFIENLGKIQLNVN